MRRMLAATAMVALCLAPASVFGATSQTEFFDSAAQAATNGWTLYSGPSGWGWQNTGYAGGDPGEAVVTSYTAGIQRWYADTDLGGDLSFLEDWQASGRMDFFESSASDGGMFFGFFNRETSLGANTQTMAGFLLVNNILTLRFERRPNVEYVDSADFGLWVNGDRAFTLAYDADGGGVGVGRLTATLTSLADNTSITRSFDIAHSVVSGATLNSFGFYTTDYFDGRYTPVGWAVDNLSYGPVPGDGAPRLSSFSLSTAVVAGCKTLTGVATLSSPAPKGGLEVAISDTLAAASAPAVLKLRKGATSGTVTIGTTPVSTVESGTVSATLGGLVLSQGLSVRPIGVASIGLKPAKVRGGRTVSGSVNLECEASPGPILAELDSSMPEIAYPAVPSIVIPAGTQSAPFSVLTTPVATKATPSIQGTANGISASAQLTVSP